MFWEDRVAPLLDFNAFPWIALLRQQGEVPVPAGQKQEFPAELLRLPDLPRLDLPEEMRYEEVGRPPPRPYLTIKRRDDRPFMSDRGQNWLIGDLSFGYDGHIVPAGARPGASSSPTSDGCCGRPGGRAVLRGKARGGRLPQDRLPPGRRWSCSRATCRKPRALLQEGWQ